MRARGLVWSFNNLLRVILALVIVVSAVMVGIRFKLTTDLTVFTPPTKKIEETILINQLGRGATSQLMFIALYGNRPEILAATSRQLAEQLQQSPLFKSVHNGEQGFTASDLDILFEYRYLISKDLDRRLSTEGLKRDLKHRLRGLGSPLAALEKRFLAADPSGIFLDLVRSLTHPGDNTAGPLRDRGVWMTRDDSRALLVAEIVSDAFDLEQQVMAVKAVKRTLEDVGPGAVSMVMTGPPVFAVDTRDVIRSDVRLLSTLAVIAVAAFLFLVFWSGTFLLLVMIPLAIGSLVAIASVVLVFGSIHGVTLAFGVTLTGVAVDYPIHLVSQFNGSPAKAREHVRQIWPTIRLGVITTLIAYASLIFSDFTGLTQLGLFTVTGLLTAAGVTRWWLPLMVPKGAVFRHGMRRPHNLLERLGRRAPRARTWAALGIIVAAAFLILVDQPIHEYNIDSLSPIPPQRRLDDRQLRNDLGMWSGGKLLAVVAPNAEQALRKSEQIGQQLDQLRAVGVLRDFEFAARYLPSQWTQRQRQLRLPTMETLRSRFNIANDGLPFKRDAFEPFFNDIERARAQPPLTIDVLRQTTVGSLLATMLFQLDKQWVATILLHDVRDPVRLHQVTGLDGETETVYIDLKSMSNAVMVRATDRILRLLGWGGLFIYLVLTINFRDVRKPLYILVPTIAAVLVVTALLVASGVKLTVFHMVALLLVIGLGLDYALFFNRLTHSEQEWATTFKALWVCCVTTVLVFGILMLSHTPPLQAVGLTVAMGAALCLVFGAIWSTAAPRRRKRKRKWRRKKQPIAG